MANFRECLKLELEPEQNEFVASNMFSLAEAKADGVSIPLAIYTGDTMVGFVMYWYDRDNHRGHIDRLMVDHHHQGHGYGKAAMVEVIEKLKNTPGCRDIQTSFAHDNVIADKLYAGLGFQRTGEVTEDGEEAIVVLKLK